MGTWITPIYAHSQFNLRKALILFTPTYAVRLFPKSGSILGKLQSWYPKRVLNGPRNPDEERISGLFTRWAFNSPTHGAFDTLDIPTKFKHGELPTPLPILIKIEHGDDFNHFGR